MKIASIGIDIGKTTFHLVALDEHGSIVIRRKFSRKALLVYTAKLASSLIGMEACGGAHCLARRLDHVKHGDRADEQWFHRRLRCGADAVDLGYL
jgi:transposase